MKTKNCFPQTLSDWFQIFRASSTHMLENTFSRLWWISVAFWLSNLMCWIIIHTIHTFVSAISTALCCFFGGVLLQQFPNLFLIKPLNLVWVKWKTKMYTPFNLLRISKLADKFSTDITLMSNSHIFTPNSTPLVK